MHKPLPIWRDAVALLTAVETAVRHFPRYHKYALGTDLRRQAMLVCRLVHRAWVERERANVHLDARVLAWRWTTLSCNCNRARS